MPLVALLFKSKCDASRAASRLTKRDNFSPAIALPGGAFFACRRDLPQAGSMALAACGRHDAGNLYHSARVISLVGEVSHSPPARHFPATSPTVGDRH
jgi:hypothetical protein